MPKKKPLDLTLPIFQLKISLQHISPPIWRRVQMDDCNLEELHDVIQIAMGWDDEHMFAFVIDGKQYGDVQRGGDFDHDARSVRLSDLAEQGAPDSATIMILGTIGNMPSRSKRPCLPKKEFVIRDA